MATTGTTANGQDVTVTVVRDGEVVQEIPFESITVTDNIGGTDARYLGEQANSKDETYEDTSFELTGHPTGSGSQGVHALRDFIVARAQRKTTGTVNITYFVLFPNGDLKGYTLNNCIFGSPSMTASGADRVSHSISGTSNNVVAI